MIETRPAKAPLIAIVRSALPNNNWEAIRAAINPPAAAALVFTKISATALASPISETFSSDPPLKPNQPIHKINIPIAAKGKLDPGIAFTLPSDVYFPLRAPSSMTPAIAAVAPQRCTTPEPAKSWKPAASRNPPPHFHIPCIG